MPTPRPPTLPEPCTCTVVPNREVARLLVAGEIDLAAVPIVDAELAQLRAVGFDRIDLDLTEVTFVDSQGVALVAAWRIRAVRGRFAFDVRPPPDAHFGALLDVADALSARP